MNNPVKLRGASGPSQTVTDPAQPLANHRSHQSAVIPERHEAIVSPRKIFLGNKVRFDSLVPVEPDPMFDNARATHLGTQQASRSFSCTNPTWITELTNLAQDGSIVLRDGHWLTSESGFVPSGQRSELVEACGNSLGIGKKYSRLDSCTLCRDSLNFRVGLWHDQVNLPIFNDLVQRGNIASIMSTGETIRVVQPHVQFQTRSIHIGACED